MFVLGFRDWESAGCVSGGEAKGRNLCFRGLRLGVGRLHVTWLRDAILVFRDLRLGVARFCVRWLSKGTPSLF